MQVTGSENINTKNNGLQAKSPRTECMICAADIASVIPDLATYCPERRGDNILSELPALHLSFFLVFFKVLFGKGRGEEASLPGVQASIAYDGGHFSQNRLPHRLDNEELGWRYKYFSGICSAKEGNV